MIWTSLCRLLLAAVLAAPFFAVSQSLPPESSGRAIYDELAGIEKQAAVEMSEAWAKAEPEKRGWWTGHNAELSDRQLKLSEKLKRQALAGDAESAFYWGAREMAHGSKFANSDIDAAKEFADRHFKDAMTGLQIASNAGMATASWNIAVLYQTGSGVIQSKLAAAEWYGRAGVQYERVGDRERALAALEQVEAIEADHPDAKSLRALLYPRKKKK